MRPLRVSIFDCSRPVATQHKPGVSARWLRYKAEALGLDIVSLSDSDVILATVIEPTQYTKLRMLRRKYSGRAIIAGGSGAYSPHVLAQHCEAVCVGEGSAFLRALAGEGVDAAINLPNMYVSGESRSVCVNDEFDWDTPPLRGGDGRYQVWLGRGCKGKCLFCQVGWGTKYSENPNPRKLLDQIRILDGMGKRVSYVTNDLLDHRFADMLPDIPMASCSMRWIRRYGYPRARYVRIGIEGVSERLRSLVNKPISNDELVKYTSELNSRGKGVRWFMVCGLPGETEGDWLEFRDVIMRWKHSAEKGVLHISFTAFVPKPSTPLGYLPLVDEYPAHIEAFEDWFYRGKGWTNRILYLKPRKAEARLREAACHMGLPEEGLRDGGEWGPNDRVAYPYKSQRNKAAMKALGILEGWN